MLARLLPHSSIYLHGIISSFAAAAGGVLARLLQHDRERLEPGGPPRALRVRSALRVHGNTASKWPSLDLTRPILRILLGKEVTRPILRVLLGTSFWYLLSTE